MLSFYSKKTAFHSSVSLHFRATNRRYGFSETHYNLFRNSLAMTLLILLMIVMMAMKSAGMHVARSEMFAVVQKTNLNAAPMKK